MTATRFPLPLADRRSFDGAPVVPGHARDGLAFDPPWGAEPFKISRPQVADTALTVLLPWSFPTVSATSGTGTYSANERQLHE